MRRRSLIALLLLSCHRQPPVSASDAHSSAAVPAAQRLPGDAIAYRFVDHAGEARWSGPSLARAWHDLTYPAKLVSPYSGLRGDDALRVIELALADADVASYGTAHPNAPAPSLKFDPVWNRTRAVYESKSALFAPGDSRYVFAVPAVANGELQVAVATPPGTDTVEVAIEADGRALMRQTVTAKEAGAWVPLRVPLAGAHTVAFVTHGAASTTAFWGEPLLVAHGGGAPGPNVLLVVIDTLRADALPPMPHLRQLAAQGAQFTQAITAATWTRPSVLAMLGGDLPTALGHGAEEMIPSDGDRRRFYAIAPPLLPRVLASNGYRSVAIGNNFFLLGYPQIGLSLGFDIVDDIRHPVLDTPAITAAAISFLETHRGEPWLLHLHYDAPHWPYTPPPQYRDKVPPMTFPSDDLARDYLAEAAYADDYLGRVIDALDRLGLAKRTLVIVVGDHGEVFDHAHAHTVTALEQPTLHHHGWSGYDELLRVPLIMRMPGTVPATRIDQQVSLIDLEPTIVDVLGLPPRAGAHGRSLRPLWQGQVLPERPAFVEGQNVRVVRAEGWAYLRRSDGRLTLPDGTRLTRDEELYDVAHDPDQHHDLAAIEPATLARMRALFEREAPTTRDAPVAVVHLRIAPDDRPHVINGVLHTDGAISLRTIGSAEASPLDGHSIRFTLRDAAQADFVVDPSSARIELSLRRDGIPLRPGQILVGEFALPLLSAAPSFALDGERLTWMDAARPPILGDHGDVLLWRDPSPITPLAVPPTNGSASEVAGMMRRWGYAQPGR
jgi:arylsulfatase A-like enzyme